MGEQSGRLEASIPFNEFYIALKAIIGNEDIIRAIHEFKFLNDEFYRLTRDLMKDSREESLACFESFERIGQAIRVTSKELGIWEKSTIQTRGAFHNLVISLVLNEQYGDFSNAPNINDEQIFRCYLKRPAFSQIDFGD